MSDFTGMYPLVREGSFWVVDSSSSSSDISYFDISNPLLVGVPEYYAEIVYGDWIACNSFNISGYSTTDDEMFAITIDIQDSSLNYYKLQTLYLPVYENKVSSRLKWLSISTSQYNKLNIQFKRFYSNLCDSLL